MIENRKPIYLGYEPVSTNNRMEGMAILAALQITFGEEVILRSDSQLWVNILTKWAENWEKKGYAKAKNTDLVIPAFRLYRESDATIEWVPGHSGDPGNTDADYWANKARWRGINANHSHPGVS